jgi:hypothetical protein
VVEHAWENIIPFEGETEMAEKVIHPRKSQTPDGYNEWQIEFPVPNDTTDMTVRFFLNGHRSAPSGTWARAVLWFEVEGVKVDTLYEKSTDGGQGDFDTYTFEYGSSGFQNTYNGKRVNFVLKEANKHATVDNFEFYVVVRS